jgi:hypothetical protein
LIKIKIVKIKGKCIGSDRPAINIHFHISNETTISWSNDSAEIGFFNEIRLEASFLPINDLDKIIEVLNIIKKDKIWEV